VTTPSIDYVIPDRTLIDYTLPEHDGYPDDLAEADTAENLMMMGATDFPSSLWIEPKDWKTYAADNKLSERNLWPTDFKGRFTNQHPTHECTAHSLTRGAEIAYAAQHAGAKKIAFSQIGIYAIANPGQTGGANCLHVLRIAMEQGFIPENVWGQDAIYEHTLHGTCGKGNADNSRGPWVTERSHPQYFSGAAETRKLFKPTEVINPRSREEMACCILHGRAVNVGRRGHAVPLSFLIWEPNQRSEQPTFGYDDSYDVQRFDSWAASAAAVSGSSCIWNMTMLADQ
jgi:hypothetical protein